MPRSSRSARIIDAHPRLIYGTLIALILVFLVVAAFAMHRMLTYTGQD